MYGSPLQEATSEPSAEKLTPLTCELYFGCKLVTTLTTLCNGRLRLSLSGGQNAVYASPPLNLRLSPGERGEGVGKTVNLTVLSTQRTMLTCKYALP